MMETLNQIVLLVKGVYFINILKRINIIKYMRMWKIELLEQTLKDRRLKE